MLAVLIRHLIMLATVMVLSLPLAAPGASGAQQAGEGLFAELITSRGRIVIRLFYKRAPLTVMNFIGLAEGTREWKDPETGKTVKRPLYKHLTFHRTRDFMIQTGDPKGDGTGGAGYVFDDEFDPSLTFGEPGRVAMANRGPNTNSSQFFITRKPAPWLKGHYTLFGEVVSGMEIVRAIKAGDRLDVIRILRKGAEAERFNARKAHELAEAHMKKLLLAARKILPEPATPVDPARVPKPGQPKTSPGSFEFMVIGHKQIRGVSRLRRVFYYDREGALKVARKIVRLARAKGADFSKLVERYSDVKGHSRAENVSLSPRDPVVLERIFHLLPGQISDPLDMPGGVYVFKRLK